MADLKPLRGTTADARGIFELIRRMGDGQGTSIDSNSRNTQSQIMIVKCGDLLDPENLIYDGTARLRKAADLTWTDQESKVFLQDANNNELLVGQNYGAIRYGFHGLDDGETSGGQDIRPLFMSWVEGIPPKPLLTSSEETGGCGGCFDGVAPACMFVCQEGFIVPRNACLQLMPRELAEAIGLRIALIGPDGNELTDLGTI